MPHGLLQRIWILHWLLAKVHVHTKEGAERMSLYLTSLITTLTMLIISGITITICSIIFYAAFWSIRKQAPPETQKDREREKAEQVEHIRKLIREELTKLIRWEGYGPLLYFYYACIQNTIYIIQHTRHFINLKWLYTMHSIHNTVYIPLPNTRSCTLYTCPWWTRVRSHIRCIHASWWTRVRSYIRCIHPPTPTPNSINNPPRPNTKYSINLTLNSIFCSQIKTTLPPTADNLHFSP